jgi:hypothetical protein
MKPTLRRIAAQIGRPMIGPVRSQLYAWIDYRIRTGGDPGDQLKRAWSRDAAAGPMPVSFAEVVPALLNSISCTNTAARQSKRNEIEMQRRLAALEEQVRTMQTTIERLTARNVSAGGA